MSKENSKTNAARTGRVLFWAIGLAPIVVQALRYVDGSIYYGELLHWSGLQATHLLLLVLAVSPLQQFLPTNRFVGLLRRYRRDVGVLTFVYAAAHTAVYLERTTELPRVLAEATSPDLLAGWVALFVLAILAVTSNNLSVRTLRGRWKALHRSVYAAALLTMIHWILTAFDPTSAYVYLAALIALLISRLNRGAHGRTR